MMLLGITAWSHFTSRPVHDLDFPVHTALRVVERTMEAREGARDATWPERALLWLSGDSPDDPPTELADIYRDALSATEREPATNNYSSWIQAHLIVLLGEAGATNDLTAELRNYEHRWPDTDFAPAVRFAYLGDDRALAGRNAEQAPNYLSEGWTRDRFTARLAAREGRAGEAAHIDTEMRARGQRLRWRAMWCEGTILVLAFGGVAVTVFSLFKSGLRLSAGPDATLGPWPFRDGWGAAFAGFVCGAGLATALSLPGWRWADWVVRHLHSLFMFAPVLLFLTPLLLRPWALSFGKQFGLAARHCAFTTIAGGGLALVGLGFACFLLVMTVSAAAGVEGNWTEGISEDLLHGTTFVRAVTLLNMAVVAPVFEELVFRGILYGTLRSRFSVLPAALISSALFGLGHFYSLPGLVDVTWFGFVSALIYERTRSLAPCMAGHMLMNLTIGIMELAVLG